MKKGNYFVYIVICFLGLNQAFAQQNQGNCNVDVVSAECLSALDYCGTTVVFKNNGNKTIDAISYKISFYNKFDDLLGTRIKTWTGDIALVDTPITPGETERDTDIYKEFSEANTIRVSIRKVHYTDHTTCY